MTYADLLRFNPWWERKEAIAKDRDILEFSGEKIRYRPAFPLERGVYVIRGPRQVGKTTLVKLKIRELLDKGIEPENCFFYSFELMKRKEEVHRVILEYLETVAKDGKRHLFLDETTTVPDWSSAVKALVDRGDLKKEDAVLVTGSSSIDLGKGAERLPGRGIEGNEYYYLPCSFRTYLSLKGIEIESAGLSTPEIFYGIAKKNLPKILTLGQELNSFLKNGGFLYSINHGKNELTMERYARWLEGDFIKWGKNPLIVKEILQAVIKKGCSQFSYHSIAKETSVTSHNTIIDYLDMLDEELFLRTSNKALLPFEVDRKREKKAFFVDPLLLAVAEHWADQILPEPCKIENVVKTHLSRLGCVHFYNDGKKEIDCFMKIGNKTLGIEIKWSNSIGPQDTYAVRKTDFPYVLSKEELKMENGVPVIPVALFLAILDAGEIVKRNVLVLK